MTSLAGYALTVNQRLPPVGGPELPLQSGDLVQVLPLSEVLSRSPPQGCNDAKELDIFRLGRVAPVTVPLNAAGNSAVPLFCGFHPANAMVSPQAS